MTGGKTYYGKYRAIVLNNIDPQQLGRIQAIVPDVSAVAPTTWALPCVPIAGKRSGISVVPQIGSGVWMEFEQGNPDFPIWVGGFWGTSSELPPKTTPNVPISPNIVLQSPLQHAIVISDVPGPDGGIILQSSTGVSLIVNDTGIYIKNGLGASVVLKGPKVTLNDGALEIT